MADGAQDQSSFDPSQDQDFLKAPPERQHAYLSSVDPDYANARPARQKAYLDHVNGTHYTEEGGTNRPVAPLPANPIQAARPGGEEVHGGGGEAARPERQALVKEAGSPLGVPLAIGARALESLASKKHEENLSNAATGRTPQRPAPDEANIALPEGAGLPDTQTNVAPFLERSGADAMRAAAVALTPTSLGIAAAAPLAPVAIGTGLLLHGGKTAIENAPAAIKGDPDAAQRALNAGAEATGGAGLAGSGVAAGAPDINAMRRMGRTALDSNMGLKTLGVIKPEPEQALTRAIQPGVNIPRAQESMPIGGPRLQQVKNSGLVTDEEGNPITEFKGNKDILQGVKAAKQYVWNALEQRAGSVEKLSTPTKVVGNAMRNSISERTREQYPELADKIEKRAATYDGTKTFRSIENAIQDANDDLKPLYNRGSANPSNASTTAEMTATEAEIKALRNLLDEKVEALTGSGTKELKREYGALRDIERASAKQYAIETRQKGATLWEGLAALRAAGDFVSGNMLGAAKGAATMAMGRRLATVRSPQWLIDQAFQGPKAFRAAPEIAPPPGVKIAGALPAAGDSQASHVRSEPGIGSRGAIQGPPKPPVSGPNAPPIDVDNGPGRSNAMPSSGKPIVTPRAAVEHVAGAPELPEGPHAPRQLSGPQMQKALPAARQIQVGPSSLPPEGAPKPPAPGTPKEPPTNGVLKAVREAMAQTPTASRATPAVPKPEPSTPKVTSRSESLKTYNSLPKEAKEAVDAEAGEIPHLPQLLREGRMRQLESFGGKGTFLKEKMAKEAMKYIREHPESLSAEAAPTTQGNAAKIKQLQQRERELIDQSSRVRDWTRGQKLIRQARDVNERWNAIKRGMQGREPRQ